MSRKPRSGGRVVGRILIWIGRIIGTMLLVALTTGAILAVIASIYVSQNLNQGIEINLRDFNLNLTSFVYYKDPDTGAYLELESLSGPENRVWSSYNEFPRHLEQAVVAIEDKRFYSHDGVDWYRTVGAFTNMFTGSRDTYGGSTITQQLIKNLTGNKEATVQRKLKEIMMALEVERNYNKKEIMELYLNTIYLSHGCYGIKTAAEYYFGKEVRDLTLAESACLVGITNYPSLYDPIYNPARNKTRQEYILNEMMEQGYIDEATYRRAVAEPLNFTGGKTGGSDTVQSYYVDQVILDVSKALAETLNVEQRIARQGIYSAGYRIYTSIDMNVQNVMDEVFGNEENYPAVKSLDKPQVAMTIIDPYTGAIVGMTGGRGEKTGALTLNRAQSRRSPGSAIKPLSVYAPAIDMGLITPYSAVLDAPFKLDSKDNMWPKNLTGSYAGQMSVMYAVQVSNNAAAVQTLQMVTPLRAFEYLTEYFKFTTLVSEKIIGNQTHTDIDYAPLSLGGMTYGVTTREMAAGYAAFVNRGVYVTPHTFDYVTDSNGKILLDNRQPETSTAISEKTAYYMNTLLQNVVTNGTGALARLDNMPSAGKTGTTTSDYDRWWVGYTPYYVGAVWFGYDEPQEIRLEKTQNPSVNMWKQVMEKIHADLPPKDFFTLPGLEQAEYCLDSGMAPTAACRADSRGSRVRTGSFAREDVPGAPCSAHVIVTLDAVTRYKATPYCPDTVAVGFLTLNRRLTVPNAVLNDEQYVLRAYVKNVDDGLFPPAAPANAVTGANAECQEHKSPMEEPIVTPPPDPTPTESGATPIESPTPVTTPVPATATVAPTQNVPPATATEPPRVVTPTLPPPTETPTIPPATQAPPLTPPPTQSPAPPTPVPTPTQPPTPFPSWPSETPEPILPPPAG